MTQDTTLSKEQLLQWAHDEREKAQAIEADSQRKRVEATMRAEMLGGLIDFNNEVELRRIYDEHMKATGPLSGCKYSPVGIRQRAERLISGVDFHNKRVGEFETFARENPFLAMDVQRAFRGVEASERGLLQDEEQIATEISGIKNFLQERRAGFSARADRLERERVQFEAAAAGVEAELGEVVGKFGPMVKKAIGGIRKPGKK
jgi:hypothetical protein